MPDSQEPFTKSADLLRAYEALVAEHRTLTQRIEGRGDLAIADWWEQSFCEPTVAHAIRDHVRPGAVVYDVGANAGALSMQMSRLAGPRGIVCAFEASPRILPRTQYNLIRTGCFNVTLFHRAVWHTSGAIVNIAPGTNLNDRIDEDVPGVPVTTLALDDFSASTGLIPSFIKMDIEGAEFAALCGMPRLLNENRPVLVLEQSPEDMRCHALLIKAGYRAIDLASYREIRTAADFPASSGVVNVLFAPWEQVGASPYFSGNPEHVLFIDADHFVRAENGDVTLPDPPTLPSGRYIVRAAFTAVRSDNEMFGGIEADGKVIIRYHTNGYFLAACYRDWVIQLDRPTRIAPYLRFLRGSDPDLVWSGAEVLRLPAFDTYAKPLIS